MKVYLVGGAVRDALLGRPVKEHDWVVVGSTPEEMLRLGYRQVGRDFPVFLHPDTSEEYALARTERKTGPGHTGFVCHAGPDVTLEDDLRRRDLTVNAMARQDDGSLADPFGGRADLDARVLRHVSEAFVEDPLRVFRVARFAAQLDGFEVAPETLDLMRRMAGEGALAELAAERVWQELYKALGAAAPGRFFEVLDQAHAMRPWFDELIGLDIVFPAELDAPDLRFGALAWQMPPADVTALSRRCRLPKRLQRLGEQVATHGRTLADWRGADSTAVLDALGSIGALGGQRDPAPALTVVAACAAVDLTPLRRLIGDLAAVSAADFEDQGLSGKELGAAIDNARRDLLTGAQQASRG